MRLSYSTALHTQLHMHTIKFYIKRYASAYTEFDLYSSALHHQPTQLAMV